MDNPGIGTETEIYSRVVSESELELVLKYEDFISVRYCNRNQNTETLSSGLRIVSESDSSFKQSSLGTGLRIEF